MATAVQVAIAAAADRSSMVQGTYLLRERRFGKGIFYFIEDKYWDFFIEKQYKKKLFY